MRLFAPLCLLAAKAFGEIYYSTTYDDDDYGEYSGSTSALTTNATGSIYMLSNWTRSTNFSSAPSTTGSSSAVLVYTLPDTGQSPSAAEALVPGAPQPQPQQTMTGCLPPTSEGMMWTTVYSICTSCFPGLLIQPTNSSLVVSQLTAPITNCQCSTVIQTTTVVQFHAQTASLHMQPISTLPPHVPSYSMPQPTTTTPMTTAYQPLPVFKPPTTQANTTITVKPTKNCRVITTCEPMRTSTVSTVTVPQVKIQTKSIVYTRTDQTLTVTAPPPNTATLQQTITSNATILTTAGLQPSLSNQPTISTVIVQSSALMTSTIFAAPTMIQSTQPLTLVSTITVGTATPQQVTPTRIPPTPSCPCATAQSTDPQLDGIGDLL
jgi:hypothetical protein